MTRLARDVELSLVIDEEQALRAVQASLRAAILAAHWPRALSTTAEGVLSQSTHALGGQLTPWVLAPLRCCTAVCGDWAPALPAATAAELYSIALDLCDDVEDGDRSAPVERYGAPVVLNLATALLSLAHLVLQPPPRQLSRSDEVACRRAQDALWQGLAVATGGQHCDLVAAGAAPLSVEDCLDIARRKGGALVEACCRAGAAFGTDDAALIERLGLFGRSLGLVAQLDNDMHDADDAARKSDLAQRKQTIPIAIARAYGDATNDTPADLGEAVWRGGIQMAYALVHAERARAQEALETAAMMCPDPLYGRRALEPLLIRRDNAAPASSKR